MQITYFCPLINDLRKKMVSVIVLCFEILLDIVGLVTGIIVLTRASDNKIQQAWGILAISLSLLLLCDNIEWIWLFNKDVEEMPHYTEVPLNHLSLWHIVRTVIFFQFFSLFPIASLKPGWMTIARILNFFIPILLILCIACCYQLFSGHYTILKSFSDIHATGCHPKIDTIHYQRHHTFYQFPFPIS